MNKKEDFFNKQHDRCLCNDNSGLFIPNRQLSIIVAALLFLFFGFFMTGYFFGKRFYVEQITQKMTEETLADQLYSSIALSKNLEIEGTTEKPLEIVFQDNPEEVIAVIGAQEQLQQDSKKEDEQKPQQFYAELIGFVTEKAAQKFSQKLAAKNIETIVKTRISKTAKGKIHHWYQVVTPFYEDRETLILLTNRLAKEERLDDINIRAC